MQIIIQMRNLMTTSMTITTITITTTVQATSMTTSTSTNMEKKAIMFTKKRIRKGDISMVINMIINMMITHTHTTRAQL